MDWIWYCSRLMRESRVSWLTSKTFRKVLTEIRFRYILLGYRDDSLETVKRNRDDYEMPLKILSYEELYGWTMDRIVGEIGKTNNCTFCGVFRRQALDRGARTLKVDSIATGHNADDIAETVLMNILRGDTARLGRCTAIKTVNTLFCRRLIFNVNKIPLNPKYYRAIPMMKSPFHV